MSAAPAFWYVCILGASDSSRRRWDSTTSPRHVQTHQQLCRVIRRWGFFSSAISSGLEKPERLLIEELKSLYHLHGWQEPTLSWVVHSWNNELVRSWCEWKPLLQTRKQPTILRELCGVHSNATQEMRISWKGCCGSASQLKRWSWHINQLYANRFQVFISLDFAYQVLQLRKTKYSLHKICWKPSSAKFQQGTAVDVMLICILWLNKTCCLHLSFPKIKTFTGYSSFLGSTCSQFCNCSHTPQSAFLKGEKKGTIFCIKKRMLWNV